MVICENKFLHDNFIAQVKVHHNMLLANISGQLTKIKGTLTEMGFYAKAYYYDPYSIVVEGKNMTDRATRKAIHDLMRKEGLVSVAENIRVPVCLRSIDGSESDYVKCKNCSYIQSVDYKKGRAYMDHTHILGPDYFEGEPDWCQWDNDYDEHEYPHKAVLGRIIIFHPDHQPRLSKQARARLSWHVRRHAIATTLWCFRMCEFPRDVSYIITQQAFGIILKQK